ncbi:MAG: hypothetical protein PHQ35_00090 [Phycisphaerae bacterium]|nr:hypothetical protein [Phycisphaerae bacterium]MDD5381627.1 hypothetical protein [Phycisphaerae bacterium]
MKPITKQSDKKTAFTIIELLTVMSIIVILIGLLLPSLNMAKRYAKEVRQRAQFHSIGAAMELFSANSGWGGYPPSDALDTAATPLYYCGAQKLCEAMMGQDLAGFHPDSQFLAACTDGTNKLYNNNPVGDPLYPTEEANLKLRKGPYLETEKVSAYRLSDLYANTGSNLDPDLFVLCDVYNRVRNRTTGKGVGMPVLYYKANKANTKHDPNAAYLPTTAGDNGYIYNYLDNDDLVLLGLPGSTTPHPMASTQTPEVFYEMTRDSRVSLPDGWPYRPDSYILLSAGFDGLYGTDDDIFNFDKAPGQ